MEFPKGVIEAIKNGETIIAFLNPENYNNGTVSIIKNRMIDVIGNASQVYIYLEFQQNPNIDVGEVVFNAPDKTKIIFEDEIDDEKESTALNLYREHYGNSNKR